MITKRESILETAMRLFIENGIESTSTASIAKEAGVATGTLFHHFKTKEDLVHDLYHAIFDSLIEYHKAHFDEQADVQERLRQIWALDIEWGTTHQEFAHFLERYSFHFYASASAIEKVHQRFDYCMRTFEEAVAEKLVKSDDIFYVKDHYLLNIRMNIIYFINHPERCTEENIDRTFDIYWNGVRNSSS